LTKHKQSSLFSTSLSTKFPVEAIQPSSKWLTIFTRSTKYDWVVFLSINHIARNEVFLANERKPIAHSKWRTEAYVRSILRKSLFSKRVFNTPTAARSPFFYWKRQF